MPTKKLNYKTKIKKGERKTIAAICSGVFAFLACVPFTQDITGKCEVETDYRK